MSDIGSHLDGDVGLWVERIGAGRFEGRPALFLDRDGVLVEETNYLGRAEDVRMIPGVASAIAKANAASIAVVLVTNQAGIARGYYDWHGFRAVQSVIYAALAQAGARLDLVLACAYHESGTGALRVPDHPWRKPGPGMFHRAVELLAVAPERSFVVGDKMSDLQAGLAAGLRAGALTRTGHGGNEIAGFAAWAEDVRRKAGFRASTYATADAAILAWLDEMSPAAVPRQA